MQGKGSVFFRFSFVLSGRSAVWWVLAFFLLFAVPGWSREVLPLSGDWQLSFTPDKKEDTVVLPGTMDEWGKGNANTNRSETKHLSRLVTFEGEARYRKEVLIPESFKDKRVFLHLERTKYTSVFVDGHEAGTCNLLQTPHRYDLTGFLTPGVHTITVVVDNRKSHYPGGVGNSHALVEHTQTNWNGILGEIFLEARPSALVESAMVFPRPEDDAVRVRLRLRNYGEARPARIELQAVPGSAEASRPAGMSRDLALKPGLNEVVLEYPMGKDSLLWSEFSPALYVMSCRLEAGGESDENKTAFGMRRFSTSGTHFCINGKKTFLRDKHDACVFPLTGYAPMDKEAWLKYLGKLSSYGINYVRFHSWTPPKAAFEAADELGMYLQPEIPYWGGVDGSNKELMDFYRREGAALIEAYSSHPSFVMFALGNELGGSGEAMRAIIDGYRGLNADVLYSFGSNNNLGRDGYQKGEDFLTTCRIGRDENRNFENHVRSSFSFADAEHGGILNGVYPSTRITYEKALAGCPVPVIGHETGQFQVYPDYREMEQYKGVLRPWNLQVFKERLEKAKMGDLVEAFHRASGAWAAQCYKADIELAIRTPGFGGFQMLDLQDFPGQGSALVGLLDAFMDSKGIMEGEEFSGFCHAVVPLALFDKFTWTNAEDLAFDVQVANYGADALHSSLLWKLADASGKVVKEGRAEVRAGQGELSPLSHVAVPLDGIDRPSMLTLTLRLEGESRENRYHLWVYPDRKEEVKPVSCEVATRMDDAMLKRLSEGAAVLWFPDHRDVADMSVGGMATPDYWNFAMFKGISEGMGKPVSPGTLSLLMDPEHPLFKEFPTEGHTDWQWWSIVNNSRPFILDAAPEGLRPVIRMVDNVERNHRLGLVFEVSVEKGRLLVCMADPEALLDKPEGRQFRAALIRYADSEDFRPEFRCSPEELKRIFSQKAFSPDIIKVENATDYKDQAPK